MIAECHILPPVQLQHVHAKPFLTELKALNASLSTSVSAAIMNIATTGKWAIKEAKRRPSVSAAVMEGLRSGNIPDVPYLFSRWN